MTSSHTENAVQVTMPQMGVSVAEGTILEWRKRPGDWVESDETICDVSTDKVDVEIPSPATGRLERILADPGETVAVGEPIAEIDPAAKPGEPHRDEEHPPRPAEREEAEAAERTDRSSFYSPVARRIAAEHGVDLDQVEGTGIGGRVRKKDVLAYIESAGGEKARREPALHIESPYRPDEAKAAEPPVEPAAPSRPSDGAGRGAELPGRREPMSEMRKAIARHMVASRHTAAHCTTVVEVDMSRVTARRAELKEAMERRGVPLTYLAFVARATVETLAEHPVLNASVEGDEIVYHDDVNLGIAVALDAGLIVPVIPKAQRLSLEGLAAAIADVAGRARSRDLHPDEVHGGTFTITNPGQFGAVLATPIINQPQVAILDLEAIVKRPVVIEAPRLPGSASGGEAAEGSTDAIAIRPMTYLPMSWDHRALDGVEAARFLSRVKERLESWGST
ncbi:MAG TPA: dihydrolipoamide acetyltransferase family protein [Solirubrobacterales bacterium]|nr:dihydrolipoamide acetyltransferase family protein [Solirubrobacterales bacterium]